MARATTRTKLPLDTFARILGINPLHFNQVTTDQLPAVTCSQPWKQWAWQESQKVGREDIAQAIKQAEDDIERKLGDFILPTWVVDHRQNTARLWNPRWFNLSGLDLRSFPSHVQLPQGYFISGGIEAKSLISANVPITYTDEDGDGYDELATISFSTTVTDPEEIAVYFPEESGSDAWEIRPLRSVAISGGICTITMHKHQLVKPDLWEALNPGPVDGDDNENFLAAVDAYRHYNDPQTQVNFLWTTIGSQCGCGSDTCVLCQQTTQTGCLDAIDFRHGIVGFRPGSWDAVNSQFTSEEFSVGRNPDRLRLWYRAGWQDKKLDYPHLEMDRYWAQAVTYYALTLLDRPLCGCENLTTVVRKWAEDFALSWGNQNASQSYDLSASMLESQFGTTRGGLFAWQRAKEASRGHAVLY